MCSNKMVDHGLAPENFEGMILMMSSDLVEDKHNAIFECSGYGYARELFRNFFPGQSSSFSISHNALGWPCSSLG